MARDIPDILGNRILPFLHPLMRRYPLSMRRQLWNRIFCSVEHRFIYFRIPKCANSTVSRTLAAQFGTYAEPSADDRGVHAKKMGKNFWRARVYAEEDLARYYTFTIVRNPFARALSAYLDKIVQRIPYAFRDLKLESQSISFQDFLGRLAEGHLHSNVHWMPQSSVIPVDWRKVDHIGRVESLDVDLQLVTQKIFGRKCVVVSRQAGTTAAKEKLQTYYGPEEIKLVRHLYAGDFKAFYPEAENP